jgi:hypothetical protein
MNHYLKSFILFALILSALPTHAENVKMSQEFRVGPWYIEKDKQQLDVVIELPTGIPQPVDENFKLRINDKDAAEASSLNTFQESDKELAWLICIQSTSALSKPFIKSTQHALLSLFKDKQSLKIALSTFGNKLKKTLSFETSSSVTGLTSAVENLKPLDKPQTKLYQSLLEALDYYEEAAKAANFPKRKRMLVIADGHDEGSVADYKNVIDRATALGIPIDTVSIKPSSKKVLPNAMSLEVLAEKTGGRFAPATAETDLASALTNVYRLLTETQTVVASFNYQPDTNQMAESAEIVLQLPSSTKLTATLGDVKNIPAPKIEPKIEPISSTPPTIEPKQQKESSPLIGWMLAFSMFLLTVVSLSKFVRIRKLP